MELYTAVAPPGSGMKVSVRFGVWPFVSKTRAGLPPQTRIQQKCQCGSDDFLISVAGTAIAADEVFRFDV